MHSATWLAQTGLGTKIVDLIFTVVCYLYGNCRYHQYRAYDYLSAETGVDSMVTTPSKEDYMEAIWSLIRDKGYARTVDVADRLGVNSASASKMIQRLGGDGLLIYERYRGLDLTDEGYKLGQQLSIRHQTLENFFQHLGMNQHEEIYETVEGIEHYVNANVLRRIDALVNYIEQHPDWWQKFILASDNE